MLQIPMKISHNVLETLENPYDFSQISMNILQIPGFFGSVQQINLTDSPKNTLNS